MNYISGHFPIRVDRHPAILRFFLFAFFFPAILYAQIGFNPDDLDYISRADKGSPAVRYLTKESSTGANYDVASYRCRWFIDPAVRAISGSVTLVFKPLGPSPDSLTLDLSSDLTVDSVTYQGGIVAWSHDAEMIYMKLPILPAPVDSVTVHYHGVPPLNGSESFETGIHSDIPVLWTLSEPYGASDWWPCKNRLTDKADSVDLLIETPAGYTAVANGLPVSTIREGGLWRFHWKHHYPIAAYLVCICVTRFSEYHHTVEFGTDTLDVPNYIYPEDSAVVSSQTIQVVPMIRLFDSLFGIYPFQKEHYGHAQCGYGGGMEHQTMSFMGAFGFELIVHELAHSWFGNKITCGSWTDIWLNEGFATYLSGLCYEYLAPSWWKRFRQVRIQKIVIQPGGSVYCSDTSSIDRIFDSRLSYAKGAMILHQLRWIMGDSAFYDALNRYLSDTLLAYRFARTSDLVSHLENAYGADLSWYFRDWFTGEGYPTYHINWSQSGDQLTFTVNQIQSHPSVDFFRMLLPLRVKNSVTDTTVTVWNEFSGETFTFTLPFTADSLLFDPDLQLITGVNTVDAIAEPFRAKTTLLAPNPARDNLTVIRNYGAPDANFEIFSDDGRKVLSGIISGRETQIGVGLLPAGMYFIRIWGGAQEFTGKFIR
ncbi:MAG: T9SS type A sorting domain-containing protein [Alphaproteobacteria bacterium]|nr:T9SS type A sorting domain-containing protein [Alphaproteobacteria bacterium]